MNYEYLKTVEMYTDADARMLTMPVLKHGEVLSELVETWQERNLILFEAQGNFIYVTGVENLKHRGEWFVIIDREGFPEEIVGTAYDLIDYMVKNQVDFFERLEVSR